jgi:HupE / UreJ protein
LTLAALAHGHDIPNDVTVQMFVKPVAQAHVLRADAGHGPALQVLVRVPLKAIRDVDFPQRLGYLDIAGSEPLLADAAQLWVGSFLEIYEGDRRLPKARVEAARISLESDRSFASYESAAAGFARPRLDNSVDVVWNQTLLDVWFEYPISSERAELSIHPALARLGQRVVTVLRFLPPGGAVRAFEFAGDPGLVRLDPRWHQAALRFVRLGFLHILDGTDHLLFLFCLVIPFRRFRALVPVVTAFTVAHSITLIASAYNLAPDALWFPPLIEMLIAASIVYMALENIVGGATVHRRWMIAFGFGLVHGFGFSFALRETLQFAGSHLLASLLSFNIGVELGQLLVLVVLIPALDLLFRRVVAERMGTIILSAIVAHTGWHWMTERWDRLAQYRFAWPEITLPMVVTGMRWTAVVLAAAGLVWWLLRRAGELVEWRTYTRSNR